MKTVNAYLFLGAKGFRCYHIADKGALHVEDLEFGCPELQQLYEEGLHYSPILECNPGARDYTADGKLMHDAMMAYIDRVVHFFSGVGLDVLELHEQPISAAGINRLNDNVCSAIAHVLNNCGHHIEAKVCSTKLGETSAVRNWNYVSLVVPTGGTTLTICVEPLFKLKEKTKGYLPTVLFYVYGEGDRTPSTTSSLCRVFLEADKQGNLHPSIDGAKRWEES